MNRTLYCGIMAASLAVLNISACTVDDEPETYGEWLQQTWGITIEGLDRLENVSMNDDGSSDATASGRIIVDGLGEQDLEVYQIQYSLADGGGMGILFTEPDTGDERYFIYDEQESWIGIGDDIAGASVAKNPDGTYSVWTYVGAAFEQEDFVEVENGYEALRIVENYNEFMSTSPYILLAAYATALTPSDLEARLSSDDLDEPGQDRPVYYDQENLQNADEPGVCVIFSEFCDCAACLVLDRAGECDRCPEL